MTAQGSTEYRFAGFDAGPCLLLVIIDLGAIPLLGLLRYPLWLYVFCGVLILALGLRVTVTVRPETVRISKKWIVVPYWTVAAREIDDVWYGGDWGLPDGANGVVVSLDGREIHVGSSRTMRALFDALHPLSVAGRAKPTTG